MCNNSFNWDSSCFKWSSNSSLLFLSIALLLYMYSVSATHYKCFYVFFCSFSTYTWVFFTSVLSEYAWWTLKSAFTVRHASQLPYSSCNSSTKYIESDVFQFEQLWTKYITQPEKQQCFNTFKLCNPFSAKSFITLTQFLHQRLQHNSAVYLPWYWPDTCSI